MIVLFNMVRLHPGRHVDGNYRCAADGRHLLPLLVRVAGAPSSGGASCWIVSWK